MNEGALPQIFFNAFFLLCSQFVALFFALSREYCVLYLSNSHRHRERDIYRSLLLAHQNSRQ